MKECCTCKIPKSLDEFGNRKSSCDGKAPYCKECGRAKDRKHYVDGQNRKSNILAARTIAAQRNRKIVRDFLLAHPCVDCGESDLIVLDFDHVIGQKYNHVGYLARAGCSETTLLAEIAKCEVRCANCHRRRTANQFNWNVY